MFFRAQALTARLSTGSQLGLLGWLEVLEHLVQLAVLQALFEVGIEAIFDLIVGAARYVTSDFAPARLMLLEEIKNKQIFFEGPLLFDNIGVQVVVPPLATLLADAARQVHGDLGPAFGAVGEHNFLEQLVLVLRPGGPDHVATVAQLQISLVALYF